MTPNELRIGNIVKLRDSGEIVRVERLSRRKCGFIHNNDPSRGYFRKYSEIEGVLIHDHWQKVSSTYVNLQWLPDLGEDESLLYDYDGVTISYIHELQNLHYALTGEELKIEL